MCDCLVWKVMSSSTRSALSHTSLYVQQLAGKGHPLSAISEISVNTAYYTSQYINRNYSYKNIITDKSTAHILNVLVY